MTNELIDYWVFNEMWDYLSCYCLSEFGAVVEPEHLRLVSRYSGTPSDRRMWLKNRISDCGGWDYQMGQQKDNDFTSGILHVGFIYLEETPEMIARLNWRETKLNDSIARSKLFLSNAIPVPIDRVAKRVSLL